MQFFKCKYLDHEEEEIIGFCLNENCQMATQYCYLCLTNNHINHQKDCFRFVTINQSIDEYIRIQKEFNEKFIEIYSKLKNSITKIFKTIDDDIQILENMKQLLQNKDYLNLKSQINIIKSYHSQEKAKQFQKQISELNNILNTIQNLFTDQKKEDDQLISKNQNTQIQEVESNQENLQLIEMSKELLNEDLWGATQFENLIVNAQIIHILTTPFVMEIVVQVLSIMAKKFSGESFFKEKFINNYVKITQESQKEQKQIREQENTRLIILGQQALYQEGEDFTEINFQIKGLNFGLMIK